MTTVYDIDQTELIEEVAKELKKIPEIIPPEWAMFAKTGAHKERPPVRNDWWHIRVASVLRYVFKRGPIGVSKLRVKYGGRKNRGMEPERFVRGSGSILRKSLQQLEKAELIKKAEMGVHKGRVVTPKGMKLLDGCARNLLKLKPAVEKEIIEKPQKPLKKEPTGAVEKPLKAKKEQIDKQNG